MFPLSLIIGIFASVEFCVLYFVLQLYLNDWRSIGLRRFLLKKKKDGFKIFKHQLRIGSLLVMLYISENDFSFYFSKSKSVKCNKKYKKRVGKEGIVYVKG